jgi:hypothetical protein
MEYVEDFDTVDDDPPLLFSVSFVWPEGRAWDRPQTKGRRSPRWYFECLVSFVKRQSTDPTTRFIIHLHESLRGVLPLSVFDGLHVSFRFCAVHFPLFWPNVARFVPLIDSMEAATVIVTDIHDSPTPQTKMIENKLDITGPDEMILTFWRTDSDSYAAEDFLYADDVAPPPDLEPIPPRDDGRWVVDGGFAMSKPGARDKLRNAFGKENTFAHHLNECANIYNWDPDSLRGTDEYLLQLYLLSFRVADATPTASQRERRLAAVVSVARPFQHSLHRRTTDPPRLPVSVSNETAPRERAARRRKHFAYDGEGRVTPKGKELEWMKRAPPRRSRRTSGEGRRGVS